MDGIASSRFADEWDAERADHFAKFKELRAAAVGPEIAAFGNDPAHQARRGRRPLTRRVVPTSS